jgi:hypothetical protein
MRMKHTHLLSTHPAGTKGRFLSSSLRELNQHHGRDCSELRTRRITLRALDMPQPLATLHDDWLLQCLPRGTTFPSDLSSRVLPMALRATLQYRDKPLLGSLSIGRLLLLLSSHFQLIVKGKWVERKIHRTTTGV